MKNRLLAFLVAAFAFVFSLQICVSAAGRYVGNKDSRVYHREGCQYVDKMATRNKTWFGTSKEAESAGYRPCQKCKPDQKLSGSTNTEDTEESTETASNVAVALAVSVPIGAGIAGAAAIKYKRKER